MHETLEHVRGENGPKAFGFLRACLRVSPVYIEMIDVSAGSVAEDRQHFGTLVVGKPTSKGGGIIGRDEHATRGVQMQGEVDVSQQRCLVGRLCIDDIYLRIDRADRPDGIGIQFSGIQPTVPSFIQKRRLKDMSGSHTPP